MKRIIVIALSLLLIVAASASWYNVSANKVTDRMDVAISTVTIEETQSQPVTELPDNTPEVTQTAEPVESSPVVAQNFSEAQNSMDNNNLYNQPNNFGNGRQQGKQGNTDSTIAVSSNQQLVTVTGTVSSFQTPLLTLSTSDSQVLSIQTGNLTSSDGTSLYLESGETVTITGWYNNYGEFSANQIRNDTTGLTYTTRKQSGRPEWAGKGQNQ